MKKRFLALAVVLIFCVGLMSMAALAADDDVASVEAGGYTAIDSVTITVDGTEYTLSGGTDCMFVTEGEGPSTVVTIYFTEDFVAAMPNGTYTITVTGAQGPSSDVVVTAELTIDDSTIADVPDEATEGLEADGSAPTDLPDDAGSAPDDLPDDAGSVPDDLPDDAGSVPDDLPDDLPDDSTTDSDTSSSDSTTDTGSSSSGSDSGSVESVAGSGIPGDINGDETVNISDVQTLLKYVNGQGVAIAEDSTDVNGDGSVNISDVQVLLKFVNGQDVTIY